MESRPKSHRPCPPGKIIYRSKHGKLYTLTATGRKVYCESTEIINVPEKRVARQEPTLPQFPLLPADIRKNAMIDVLPIGDLLSLCSTSREYQRICDDPNTWRRLLQRDFPQEPIIEDLSPRQLYWALTLLSKTEWDRGKYTQDQILRRLATGLNILRISQMIPLQRIYPSDEKTRGTLYRPPPNLNIIPFFFIDPYIEGINYSFQSIKNPNIELTIQTAPGRFAVSFSNSDHWKVEFITRNLPLNTQLSVVTTLLNEIAENNEKIRGDRSERIRIFLEILTPIFRQLNITRREDRHTGTYYLSPDASTILHFIVGY